MQDGIIDKNEGDPSCAISRLLVFSELVKRSEDSQGLDRQPNDLRSIHEYVMGWIPRRGLNSAGFPVLAIRQSWW